MARNEFSGIDEESYQDGYNDCRLEHEAEIERANKDVKDLERELANARRHAARWKSAASELNILFRQAADLGRELHRLLNTPELVDFAKAVQLEAAHQRERWASDHDGGKTAADWFWLVGYLAGKALHAVVENRLEKAQHHVITTAAALANWRAALLGLTSMRPGIEPPEGVDNG